MILRRDCVKRQGDFSLSFFNVTQGWIKFSSENLAFSPGIKKPPVLIRTHACERHFGMAWAHFQSEKPGSPSFVEAEEAGGVKGRWMSCSCVAQVSFIEGQKLWDCIRPDQRNTPAGLRWARMRRTREWFQSRDVMRSGRRSAALLRRSRLTSAKDQDIVEFRLKDLSKKPRNQT